MCSGALGASSEWRRGGLLRQEIARSLGIPAGTPWRAQAIATWGLHKPASRPGPPRFPHSGLPDQALFFLFTCPLIAFRFRSRWAHSGPAGRPNRRV